MSPSMPRKLDASSSSLFGNDDSEFLEALRKVNIPNPETPQLPIPKEPSSSSDLFGTDDSTFLDVLSKTTLPGDLPVHDKSQSDATTPKKLTPKRTTQDVEFLKRKRSISPEETSPSIMYEINAPDCQIDASYTDDSAIYGASKFEGYGEYMYRKRAKLSIQNSELEDAIDGEKSTLFQGLAIYVRKIRSHVYLLKASTFSFSIRSMAKLILPFKNYANSLFNMVVFSTLTSIERRWCMSTLY